MASPYYDECYVFIDDSNLWIMGQRAHAKKLEGVNIDPRFRVDLGRLLNLITKNCNLSGAFLYGSTPPPNDSVWDAARAKNFEVKIFERSNSGHEKEVDAAMISDITEHLCRIKYGMSGFHDILFILVTGDRDYKYTIEKCLRENVYVELWSWEDSMAVQYKRLANSEKLFTTKKLNDFEDQFSYTAYISTRDKKDIDPAHAIVYRNVPKKRKIEHQLAEHIARLSLIFYITRIDKEDSCDLIIEFTETNPHKILQYLPKLGNFHDSKPCSYPEYTHPISEDMKMSSIYYAMYGQKEDLTSEAVASSMNLDEKDIEKYTDDDGPGDSGAWPVCVRRKPGLLTTIKREKETDCRWGDHCSKAINCRFKHSEQHKQLFKKHPNFNFKYLKTTECNKNHTSKAQQRMCFFAHHPDDSWCLNCKQYGHFKGSCRA